MRYGGVAPPAFVGELRLSMSTGTRWESRGEVAEFEYAERDDDGPQVTRSQRLAVRDWILDVFRKEGRGLLRSSFLGAAAA